MTAHLNAAQVAALLGISRSSVYRWADAGRIPPAWNWREDTIAPLVGVVTRPRRGPALHARAASV